MPTSSPGFVYMFEYLIILIVMIIYVFFFSLYYEENQCAKISFM